MSKFHFISLVIIVISLFSCEKNRSVDADPDYSVPFLNSASLDREFLNLDSDTTDHVTTVSLNTYQITIIVKALALSQGSTVPSRAIVNVFRPGANSSFVKFSLPVDNIAPDSLSFTSPISFIITRGDVGNFHVVFYFQTSSGNRSNSIERTLTITRGNSIPTITSVFLPESLTIGQLSSTDSTFLVSAAVADFDGLDDIVDVRFRSLKPDSTYANNGFPISLFDDGSANIVQPPNGRSGDDVAGDGKYSRKVLLVSFTLNRTPPPDTLYTQRGNYVFTFSAIDRSGAESALISRIINIK